METIGERELWSFACDGEPARQVTNEQIRSLPGCSVGSYYELARKVAELQFLNPSYVLLFRGQNCDYKENGLTTLRPRMFRSPHAQSVDAYHESLRRRFNRLKHAEEFLSEEYRFGVARLGNTLVRRYRIVRWSILQHYEACRTPLLDVSHSLRISASFASMGAEGDEVFLFVLGVPHISGAVTVCAEEGIQTVRLAAVCPPSAMRPHLQEGYLVGEYPELVDFDAKMRYPIEQVDFARRLVAKFRFNPQQFWSDENFPVVSKTALYPHPDPMSEFAQSIHEYAYRMVPRQY